jgi:hypothetical protein
MRDMTGKVTGHGNHWRTLWGEDYDPERDVLRWVRRTLMRPARRDTRDLPDRRRLLVFFSADAGLGLAAFLIGETVITAYPYVRGGAPVAVRTQEVVPWQSGFEAQVVAEAGGQRLAFFALDGYRNMSRYQPGREQRVVLNALAYRAAIGTEPSAAGMQSLEGQQIGPMRFDIDEYRLVGEVADVVPIEAFRAPMLQLHVASPVLGTALPVYMRAEAFNPQPQRSLWDQLLGRWPLRGRAFDGLIWLVGYLVDR